jgi:hypothetical protein
MSQRAEKVANLSLPDVVSAVLQWGRMLARDDYTPGVSE